MRTSLVKPGGFWERNFRAFGEPAVRRYAVGQLASYSGGVAQAVGLNLLVYEISGSAWQVGLVNFLLFGPMLCVAPLAGGSLAPRWVKGVFLGVLTANATVSAVLLWAVLVDRVSVPILLALAFLNGVLSAIELPTRLLFIPSSLRDPGATTSALSMNILVNNFGRMLGAPIGALVFGAHPAGPFAFSVGGCLAMIACVLSIAIRDGAGKKRSNPPGLRKGLTYARSDSFASFFLPAIGAVGLFAGSYATLVPLLASSEHASVSGYTGLFLGAAAAGSVGASVVLVSSLGSRASPRFIHANQYASAFSLVLIAAPVGVPIVVLAFCLLGWSMTFANASSCAVMLQRCPPQMRGPIAGLYAMGYAGAPPFGHMLVGAVSSHFGARATFVVMGAGLALVLFAIGSIRRLPR
jgi:predicted MFS family arabinose efflux permease